MTLLGKEVLLQLSYGVIYMSRLTVNQYFIWGLKWLGLQDFFFKKFCYFFSEAESSSVLHLSVSYTRDSFGATLVHYWKRRPSLCRGGLQNKKLAPSRCTEIHTLHPRGFRTNIQRLEAQLLLDAQG